MSVEDADHLMVARLPLPSHLPEGYSVQEIYVGVGNGTAVMLVSDGAIEKVDMEPPDKPRDYPIHLVKCEIAIYVSFNNDLRIVGGNSRPILIPMEFHEMTDGSYVVDWSIQTQGTIASLRMLAKEGVADEDELKRVADSVR